MMRFRLHECLMTTFNAFQRGIGKNIAWLNVRDDRITFQVHYQKLLETKVWEVFVTLQYFEKIVQDYDDFGKELVQRFLMESSK